MATGTQIRVHPRNASKLLRFCMGSIFRVKCDLILVLRSQCLGHLREYFYRHSLEYLKTGAFGKPSKRKVSPNGKV